MAKTNFWEGDKFPIAIAHRGGGGRYGHLRYRLENTLDTFRAATNLGYKYLELDVFNSSDGKVLVMHVTLDKLEAFFRKDAPSAKKVQKLTQAEIRVGYKRDIPTLGEVLQAFPSTKFLIDAKTDEVVEPLVREIIKQKAIGRVHLNSFYFERVKKLQKLLGSDASYGVIVDRYPRYINQRLKALDKGNYANQGFSAVALPFKFMSRRRVDMIHRQGMKVLVWTPNRKAKIFKAVRRGVDGIIADKIEVLKKF